MQFEPSGVQQERTTLAWHRTALSLVAAAAVLARLTWSRLGVLALATVAVASVVAVQILRGRRDRVGCTATVVLLGVQELLAAAHSNA